MSKSERQDGWWYPWIFVGAFAIIISVNATMAFLAVDTWTGLETKDHFNKGNNYNTVLDQRTQQKALGWSSEFTYENIATADDPRSGQFVLTFKAPDGSGVSGLAIQARAVRPTHEGYDQDLVFTARGKGVYIANATLPLKGLWELRFRANRADEVYIERQRVEVR
ncbi:MAG: FixH family protein [Magnetovibrio sp.]|nr:FixH family protein [Magnetovibrio sp.]